MNSLKQMFKSKVAVPMLALGLLFPLGKASGQTYASADTKTPMSDTRSTFTANADSFVDDKDPEVASLTVLGVDELFERHYGKALDDARDVTKNGNVLAIMLNRGVTCKFTQEQIIDALASKIFTGEHSVNLRIYTSEIPGFDNFTLDVVSHGKQMFDHSLRNGNGHEDGRYTYTQVKENPSFFINGHTKNNLAFENNL